jgi:hypothetical protein
MGLAAIADVGEALQAVWGASLRPDVVRFPEHAFREPRPL